MAQNLTHPNDDDPTPLSFNERNQGIIPTGVYVEASPRLTATVTAIAAATVSINVGLVLEISDGTHQVRSEIITAAETVVGDFTTNKYIVANYTYDATPSTVPVFSISATAGTGNTITIGKVTDDTVDITGFLYTEAVLKVLQTSATVADFTDGGEAGGAARSLGNTDNFDLSLEVNNVAQMIIHDNVAGGATLPGIVSFPNQSHLETYWNVAQTITSGSFQVVNFNIEVKDTQGEYTASKFTAKENGYYVATAHVTYAAMTAGVQCQTKIVATHLDTSTPAIAYNGTYSPNVTGAFTHPCAGSVYLLDGEKLHVETYQASGSNKDTSGGRGFTSFSVVKSA